MLNNKIIDEYREGIRTLYGVWGSWYDKRTSRLCRKQGIKMADIELVIKIPEEEYKNICLMSKDGIGMALYDWIANGTPLPKGHGKLFDGEAYYADIKKHYFDNDTVIRCTELALHNAKPIIEADTEEESEDE